MSNATYPNPGVKWGLIAGLALIIINVSAWLGYPDFYFSTLLKVIIFLVMVVTAILAGLEKKRQLGGYIRFKSGIQAVFLVFVISSLFLSLYIYISFKVMSPAMQARYLQSDAAMSRSIMQKLGMPEEEIKAEMQNYGRAPEISTIIFGYVYSLIRYFFVAAIISFSIRKKAK